MPKGAPPRQVAGIRPDGTRRASLPPANPGTRFLTFNVVGQCLPRRGKSDAVAAPGGEELHRPGAAGAQHRGAHRVRPQQRQRVGGRIERRARGRASATHRQQQRQQHQQPQRRRPGAAAAPLHPRPPRRGHRCAQVFGRLGAQRLRRGTSCLRREAEPADPARHGPVPPLAPPSGPARRPQSRRRQKPGAGLPASLRAPFFAVRRVLRATRVLASAYKRRRAQPRPPSPARQMIGVEHTLGQSPGRQSLWATRGSCLASHGPVSNGKGIRWNGLDRWTLFPESAGDPTKRREVVT